MNGPESQLPDDDGSRGSGDGSTFGDSAIPSAVQAPKVTLPKGGGAIRGIGEKFDANPVTGTGTLTVPIAVSPGRSGFGPELSVAYNSGAGNGPFGFGWDLSLPSITRRTDKGLPKYQDQDESDVFILSGAEDLVPVLDEHGNRYEDRTTVPEYVIHRYRPRIEGLFARIERWTNNADPSDVHWRTISKDNILTLYGKDAGSRIADPVAPERIFAWLICETRDDKGNAILYEHKPEDGAGVDLSRAHERNRGDRRDPRRTANRYINRIYYGNRVPLLDEVTGQRPRSLTVEANPETLVGCLRLFSTTASTTLTHRSLMTPANGRTASDPFSSYRAAFEVRTCRICQRVLMFHHFVDEYDVGSGCLVRSTDFTYSHQQDPDTARDPVYALLRAVTQTGYKREDGGYLKRSLPPVEFEYTQPVVQDTVEDVDPASLENLPIGVDGTAYQWTDVHGEGVPGILTEQAGAWFYKRNLSPMNEDSVTFAPLERVAAKPSFELASGAQFMDLAGDGQPDLVVLDGPTPGLFEHDGEEGWQPFRPFMFRLNRDTRDPHLNFVDLSGDGHADVLISEDEAFVWHRSLGEDGFDSAQRVAQAMDEENGPRLVFADDTQSIYLADLSGDSLTDLVRIRNGEICYWPNLGYARFGAKVSMDHAPYFDDSGQFDHKRVRLADIDGTGTTDIIYLHRDGVRLYYNQSGNGWSEPYSLSVFPRVDDLVNIVAVDLLGNGTTCLLWSSSTPNDARRSMRFVNLMGGRKPHLLSKTVNNLGTETRVQYASSTKFYLRDKYAGKPWLTRLPFPVHVVERVETYDHISGNRFFTRYAFHHGYFDNDDREFRGFGMVEQWDTEEFESLTGDGTLPATNSIDAAFQVPPVLTRTWFHTGIHLGPKYVSDLFAGVRDEHGRAEYYREPAWRGDDIEAKSYLLPDTVMPPNLLLAEERDASRALKGSLLRQEVYAQDGTPHAEHPYSVTEQNFSIRRVQPREGNRHAVFFTHSRETINYHYERNPTDPRVSHVLTLEADAYGNILKEVTIGYGRRTASIDPELNIDDKKKQTMPLLTYSENFFTNAVLSTDHYRSPLSAETRTYELTGFNPENTGALFSLDEWSRNDFASLVSAEEIPYDEAADRATQQKRLIEHVRTRYRKDDLTALLPLGDVEPMALPGESYRLALTPGLLAHVFKRENTGQVEEYLLPSPTLLLEGQGHDQGGYVTIDGSWWTRSGLIFYDPGANATDTSLTAAIELEMAREHFYSPRKLIDAFGQSTTVTNDQYDLLVSSVRDAGGNTVTAANTYRVLQPKLVTDPNGNRAAASFDALGMVVATAVMGKADENLGDLLEDFDADLSLNELQDFVADPEHQAAQLLGKATTRIVYDLERYIRTGQPPFAASVARETHVHDSDGARSKLQVSFSYSDGFGREIQNKIQAEAGEAPQRQAYLSLPTGDVRVGDLVRDDAGELVMANTPSRWVGSGRTVFNNKGKPVRQYEPFFSATHLYEPEHDITDTGVSPLLFFYDPVGRVVATLYPNHTYEKVVFDPWVERTYDVNDTIVAGDAQTGDPRTDPDIAGYVREYFETRPRTWQTWYSQRIEGQMGVAESVSAQKAAAHANTPTVAHLDAMGRTFLTIGHNRYERNGESIEEKNTTRIELDIENNQRCVSDAKHRVAVLYDYDMLGNVIHQASMEAGERWFLSDVVGKPIRTWDSRGFLRRVTYDGLRRPIGLYVTQNGVERLAERTVYGEGVGIATNHRARIYQIFDGAGVITNVAHDFKGNLLESRRELRAVVEQAVDWSQSPAMSDGSFTTHTTYDALNRPLLATSPDGAVHRQTFNVANLLEMVDVKLRGAARETNFIASVDYDAKGQRTQIVYGNGAITNYVYDPLTFRLTHLTTTRPANADETAEQIFQSVPVVQDLHYTYDPVGNITRIEDAALKTSFHNGQQISAVSDYIYDALYRLIEVQGREHTGQTAFDFKPHSGNYRDYPYAGHIAHPNDLKSLRNYTQRYNYDAVGNLEVVRHIATRNNWTRRYEYRQESLIEGGKQSNRLSGITLGNGTVRTESYAHDIHGNMTAMPHLATMVWDFEDQLQQVDLIGGGMAYYVYDGAGQRTRKVIKSKDGVRRKERIYLDGFEIYREYNGTGTTVMLERESLVVLDDQQVIALVETQTIRNGNPTNDAALLRYQFGNHLGSTSVELDESGALISYEEYYPYGTTAFQAGRSAAEVSAKRYRYSGEERDEETGFIYYGARFYVPWLGRWTSPDPAGLDAGVNLYLFNEANPIVFLDPTGSAPQKYEDQRSKDTAAKRKEMEKNLSEAKKRGDKPDPMQKRAEKIKKKTGTTPIQQHHHKGVAQAAEVKLDPKKMGDPMSSVWSTTADPSVQSGIGKQPVWDPDFEEKSNKPHNKKRTPHNVAKHLDLDEQSKGPKTAKGLENAAEASKQRLPATADLSERAKHDWTPRKPVGPPVDKTGKVVSSVAPSAAKKTGKAIGKRAAKSVIGALPGGSVAVTCAIDADCSTLSGFLYAASGEFGIGPVDLQLVIDAATWQPDVSGKERRYESLGPDQAWARERMEQSSGCQLCHDAKDLDSWFKEEGPRFGGRSAVNPANGLPYDWAVKVWRNRARD